MTLLDRYLYEQQQLTAVERFAQRYEADNSQLQAQHYSTLLPAAPPQAGEQYAFEVDLDACSGCKACVVACNSLNGLDETETWRDVGLLHGGSSEQPEPRVTPAVDTYVLQHDLMTGIVPASSIGFGSHPSKSLSSHAP